MAPRFTDRIIAVGVASLSWYTHSPLPSFRSVGSPMVLRIWSFGSPTRSPFGRGVLRAQHGKANEKRSRLGGNVVHHRFDAGPCHGPKRVDDFRIVGIGDRFAADAARVAEAVDEFAVRDASVRPERILDELRHGVWRRWARGPGGDDGPLSGIDSGAETGDDSGCDEVCVLEDPEQPAITNTIDMQSVMTVSLPVHISRLD